MQTTVDYSCDPTRHYIAVNDISMHNIVGIISYACDNVRNNPWDYKWVKIDTQNQKVLEYSDDELPSWMKVILVIGALAISIPVLYIGLAYNIIVNKKFKVYQTSKRKILQGYVHEQKSYRTALSIAKKFPLTEVSKPQSGILPQEIWIKIFNLAIDKQPFSEANETRKSISLVNREFYHLSNSSSLWNILAGKIGCNLITNQRNFPLQRALFLVSHQLMSNHHPVMLDLFQEPQTILGLPYLWLPEQMFGTSNVDITIDVSVGMRFSHSSNNQILLLIKEKPIVRLISSINGNSCLVLRCVIENSDSDDREPVWVLVSLSKLLLPDKGNRILRIKNDTLTDVYCIRDAANRDERSMIKTLLQGGNAIFETNSNFMILSLLIDKPNT